MNGMQQCLAVVTHNVFALGLQKANAVIHMTFEQVFSLGEIFWHCEFGHFVHQAGFDGVKHVVFQWAGWEFGHVPEIFGNVPAGFRGRTEEGGDWMSSPFGVLWG